MADENLTPGKSRRHGLGGAFGFAFSGICHLFRTQRNARFELGVGVIACILAAWLRVTAIEGAILVITIAIVLIVEGLDTAIEAAIVLSSPNPHPLAKTGKDVAAGAVLISAAMSVVVGLLILGPPLWHRLAR
jgi:undecaprenol kinase